MANHALGAGSDVGLLCGRCGSHLALPTPKLHPSQGYRRHPWVQAYADFMPNEEQFESPQERLQAFAAYYGLCSFLDHHVGQIVQALAEAGLADSTTLVYTSDHGDNLGPRGL